MSEGERRLAAIMFTDIVGYTALTQSNESRAMEVLERHARMLRPFFPKFYGKEVKTIGDSFLVEFGSALDAVRCAAEIQSYLHDYNLSSKEDWRIKLRIGIHLGDVIRKEGDVFGDAVNIASRIEPIAPPEGVCVSQQVYDQVANKFDHPLVSLGEKTLKNMSKPVGVYSVKMPWEQSLARSQGVSLPRDRIAVLPFRNMSPDPQDEFFAEGMTEEIISTVSGISGLSVISRTSVMGYKGTTKNIKEIGRELEVGSVLEGSLRKAGNKIRVTTQLIDVAGDKHLWAQTYDRNLDDVFEVQSDVAKQVAEALRVKILSPEMERITRKPTESTTAYTLYLKGRYLWSKRGIEELRQARDLFKQSIKEDPGFASGYSGLADCSLNLRYNFGIDPEANLQISREMVTKALELDPNLAEAHATKGQLLIQEYDVREAEEELKRAIELKPSYATAHQWYFGLLSNELRWDEALAQIERALELDPLSPIMSSNMGDFYTSKKDYGKALEYYIRSIELGMESQHGFVAVLHGLMKEFDDMRRESGLWIQYAKKDFPYVEMAEEAFYAWMEDDRDKLQKLLPEVEAHLGETGWNYFVLAMPYFYLGEKDKGFQLLEKSYSAKEGGLASIQTVPEVFDEIHNDPRYLNLLRRLGF